MRMLNCEDLTWNTKTNLNVEWEQDIVRKSHEYAIRAKVLIK